MTWLTPVAAMVVALATIPPLVALYILRLRRVERVVSSTMLWKRATEDLRANTPFQRLRLSLLFLIQLVVLALMALAIAQPQAELGVSQAKRVIMLIDHSGSMNAKDMPGGGTRLASAKELAISRIKSMHGGGIFSSAPPAVMVIALARTAEIVCPFTDNLAQTLSSIEAIGPTDESTSIKESLELARAFTTITNPDDPNPIKADPPAFELFSDGRIGDLSQVVLRGGESMQFHAIGSTESGNAGIAGLTAARDPQRHDEVQIYARAVNWSLQPLTTDIELLVDGKLRAVTPQPVELPAAIDDPKASTRIAGEAQVVFPSIAIPRSAVVTVRLARGDLLPADDSAHAVAPAARRLEVALVGRGAFALKSLLEGMPLAKLQTFSVEQWDELVAADSTAPDAFDAVVMDAVAPKSMTRGRYLCFRAPPPVDGIVPFATKEGAVVRSLRDEHALLRFVNLDELFVASMTAVAPGSDADVVIDASEGPLALTVHRGPLTVVYVTFDPMDSNWPFQRGFVNFVSNAVDWIAADGDSVAEEPLLPGDIARAKLPAGARDAQLQGPSGETRAIIAQDPTSISVGPLRQSGVYSVSWSGPKAPSGESSVSFAVNLPSRTEGRIDVARAINLASESIAGIQGGATTRTSLWPWLLLASLALLVLEWWLWVRRM